MGEEPSLSRVLNNFLADTTKADEKERNSSTAHKEVRNYLQTSHPAETATVVCTKRGQVIPFDQVDDRKHTE